MSHQVYRAQFNRPIEDAALHSLLQRAQEHYERAPGSIQLLFVEDQPTAEAQALQAAAQREVVALYREAAAREAAVIKNGGGLSFRTLTATRRRYVGPEGQPLVTSAGVSLPLRCLRRRWCRRQNRPQYSTDPCKNFRFVG